MGFNGFSRGYQKRAWSFNMTDDFKLALADIMTYFRCDVWLVLVLPFQHCVVFPHTASSTTLLDQIRIVEFDLLFLLSCRSSCQYYTLQYSCVSCSIFYINMRSTCEAFRAWGLTFGEYRSKCDQISVCEMTRCFG